MGEDEDGDDLRGFAEAATEFERATAVKMMDDATLLHNYRALSNAKTLAPSPWLELVEREVRARGLRSTN